MDFGIKGRRALITGSGKGIGRGIALSLAAEGVKLAIHYNFNPATAQETMQMLRDAGAEAVLIQADVSTAQGCKFLIEETVRLLGGLDILVNNAALQTDHEFHEYTEEHYDLIMNTNLGGYLHCTRYAAPYLKACGCGRIIYISSIHGKRPTDGDPVYSMTKGAIKMLAREASIELAQYGITCNVLSPGGVRIEFKTHVEGAGKGWKRVPHPRKREYPRLTRGGLPKDLGYMTCVLASPQSEHITGAGIRMDGGRTLV